MKIIFSPLGTVTSKYGEVSRIHPHGHYGLDLACPSGTPLHSPVDGIVIKIVDQGNVGLGKGIFIKTQDGYQFIFGHLSAFRVHVEEKVHIGDIIGLSGNSGHSTGPHVHIGVRNKYGQFIDPEDFWEDIYHKGKEIVVSFIDKIIDNLV